jgi:hypothetical protein
MRLRDMKLLVLAMFALMLAGRPADAATIPITPNNVALVPLTIGNVYTGHSSLGSDGEDSYNFLLTSAPLGTITASISFLEGIFKVAWFSGDTNITGYQLASESSPFHWILDPAGNYSLKVLNTNGPADYLVKITTTPLPPALILFGTALAGLTWLGRRRRSSAVGH